MATSRRSAAADATQRTERGPRILKKYPNRRLYDTQRAATSRSPTSSRWCSTAKPFEVRDAKTGDDLTRSILLQIILEEETGGVPMFSTQMLAQIIRFYGHAMQGMMGIVPREEPADLRRDAEPPAPKGCRRELTPELWAQFLNGQAPVMQGLMGSYLEQSQATCSRRCRSSCSSRPNRCFRASGNADIAGAAATIAPMSLDDFLASTGRTQDRLRLARLPEGADRFRADPHAAARRRLRHLQDLRRRRSRHRQHLRLHRRRGEGKPRRHRRGAGRERQGDRHRLPGREGGRAAATWCARCTRTCSPSPARTRRTR